jgi:hypothetical protein
MYTVHCLWTTPGRLALQTVDRTRPHAFTPSYPLFIPYVDTLKFWCSSPSDSIMNAVYTRNIVHKLHICYGQPRKDIQPKLDTKYVYNCTCTITSSPVRLISPGLEISTSAVVCDNHHWVPAALVMQGSVDVGRMGCSSLAAHSANIHPSKDTLCHSESLTDAFHPGKSKFQHCFLCQIL